MVDLLDLVPAATQVTVGDQQLDVYGVSISSITATLQRFPGITEQLRHKLADPAGATTMEIAMLLGPALPAFIAAGCGYPGDRDREQAADRLSIQMQIDIVAGILETTIGPDGFGPFVDKLKTRLEGLAKRFGAQEPAKPIKVRSMRSRERPSGSKSADSPPPKSGP